MVSRSDYDAAIEREQVRYDAAVEREQVCLLLPRCALCTQNDPCFPGKDTPLPFRPQPAEVHTPACDWTACMALQNALVDCKSSRVPLVVPRGSNTGLNRALCFPKPAENIGPSVPPDHIVL